MGSKARWLYSCGSNGSGQLGLGDLLDRSLFTPVAEHHHLAPTALAFGASHTLALCRSPASDAPELFVTGSNSRGQLGPAVPSSTVFSLLPLATLLAGLGPSDRSVLHVPYAFGPSVASSWETSFVLLSPASYKDRDEHADQLLVFGSNDWGEHARPPDVSDHLNADEDGTAVHLVPLWLLNGELGDGNRNNPDVVRVDQLVAGPRHVLIEAHMGPAHREHHMHVDIGWGASRHGQLDFRGDSSAGTVRAAGVSGFRPPSRNRTAFFSILTVPPAIRTSPPEAPGEITHRALGKDHTALVCSVDGQSIVACYGNNKHFQTAISGFALNERTREVLDIKCTWNGTYLLSRTRTAPPVFSVHASGSNSHGQLGVPHSSSPSTTIEIPLPSFQTIHKLVCGSEHVLLLATSSSGTREVWGWGWNEHGNLGLGHEQDVWTPTRLWPGEEGRTGDVADVWAGNGTSWMLLDVV